VEQAEKLSGVPQNSITTPSSEFKPWEGRIWQNFDFYMGESRGRNFDVNIGWTA
jgi:hypothetical protein